MNWFFVPLLLLGLITPFSIMTLILNGVSFGLLFFGLMKFGKLKKGILKFVQRVGQDDMVFYFLFVIYGLLLFFQWRELVTLVGLASFYFSFLISKKFLKSEKLFVKIFLGILFLQIINFGFVDGKILRAEINSQPQGEFRTDMASYLSTFYRIDKGEEFYQAFKIDIRNRLGGNLPHEVWGWKQPLIFYIWSFVADNGGGIMNLAIVMICLNLYLIYKIGRKFLPPVLSLFCPYVVLPYFHYLFVNATLFQVEWWALGFFIIALYFYIYEKKWEAGIFFVITLMVRELFAIPIVFVVLSEVLRKILKRVQDDKRVKWNGVLKLVLPTLVFFFPYYYFVHFQNVLRFEELDVLFSNSGREQYEGGWNLVRTTLAYGSWNYIVMKLRPFLILLGINSLVLSWKIWKDKKNRWNWFLLLGLFLPFFLASFKIGIMDVWHDYWGIYYVPFLLMITPLVVSSKLKKRF